MVIDTSAIVAILFDEPDQRRYGDAIEAAERARLNIGDCFSYALAAATNNSLLFKGDDFSHTDIRPALT